MKNNISIVILILGIGLCLSNCSKRNDPEPSKPVVIKIIDDVTSVTLPEAIGGSSSFSFSCDADWHILTGSDDQGAPTWFSAFPESGKSGTQTIIVSTVQANSNYDDRTGSIKIVSDKTTKTISVIQQKREAILVTQSNYEVNIEGGEIDVEIKSNIDYVVDIKNPEWIRQKTTRALTTNQLHFIIDESQELTSREGKIVISSGNLSETITILQFGSETAPYTSTDFSADGQVVNLQQASAGNGIDIVFLGDAFSDRMIADGTYEHTMRKAMDFFFSEEPYKSFRHLFNVYAVNVVSKNEEYGSNSKTALDSFFGEGTLVGGDDDKCIWYARKAVTDDNRMDDVLIIVMMNSNNYGGTCYMYFRIGDDANTGNDYARGLSVAYFPMGTDDNMFRELLLHEAGGHGFGKLDDEYFYQSNGTVPRAEIDKHKAAAVYGWWKNVDFTNNKQQVKWAHFIADNLYANEKLGTYEGASTYSRGAYRPTENSIMRHNKGGFNAPSREAIYYRMHKLAYGNTWTYNYQTFVAADAVSRTAAATTARTRQAAEYDENTFVPLHRPIVITEPWR